MEDEENLVNVDPVAEESLRIPAWKKGSRSKSLLGKRGVAQNPCVKGEESLKIPTWKTKSRSKSLLGKR